jgi:hypothetical protein
VKPASWRAGAALARRHCASSGVLETASAIDPNTLGAPLAGTISAGRDGAKLGTDGVKLGS